MKINNIYGYLFFCLVLLINPANMIADEISDLATASESKELSTLQKDRDNTSYVESSDIDSSERDLSITNELNKNKINKDNEDVIGGVLIQAMSLMGISYKWGGNTPETGMDCSGFIRYVFKKSMGISLPRTAAEMARVGKKVSIDSIQPGDLIFFNTLHGRRNSHVGMYIGEGQFIQSPRTGQRIQISVYNSYWRSHTNGVKRIVQEDVDEYGNYTVENFENIHNEALPSGYIKGKHQRSKKVHKFRKTKLKRSSATKVNHKVAKVRKLPLAKAKKKRV